MCLAIPARVTELAGDSLATVDILGATREISVDLTPQVAVGDYVLVHAGFAIEVVDEQFAQETIELIREFPELAADDASPQPTGAQTGAQPAATGAQPAGVSMQGMLASLADEL